MWARSGLAPTTDSVTDLLDTDTCLASLRCGRPKIRPWLIPHAGFSRAGPLTRSACSRSGALHDGVALVAEPRHPGDHVIAHAQKVPRRHAVADAGGGAGD